MLTDLITQIHAECHGIYGVRRIHAELTLGRGVTVGHNQVELLMRRAGLQDVAGRRKWKRIKPDHMPPIWSNATSPQRSEPALGHRSAVAGETGSGTELVEDALRGLQHGVESVLLEQFGGAVAQDVRMCAATAKLCTQVVGMLSGLRSR